MTAGYDDRPAIERVNLAIEPGTLLAVVGPNGGGKSTLLKVIAGLLEPWSGTRRGARRVRPASRPGGSPTSPRPRLVDWDFPVTVGDVVMMGRYPAPRPFRRPGRPTDRDAVADALEQVGMAEHAGRQIGPLSGGQRRRVFLARALAAEPDLYLLDEPVTGVDATTQEDLMDILEAEARRGRTVIATTHDLACAAQRFQHVARDQPDGRRPRPVVAGPRPGRPRRGPTAATCSSLGGQTRRPRRRPPPRRAAGGERHYHEERRTAAGGRDRTSDRRWILPIRSATPSSSARSSPRSWSGSSAPWSGTYMVLEGLAFMGDAVSHAAFPGRRRRLPAQGPVLLGAAIAAVGTALAHRARDPPRAASARDTAIGVLFAGMFALGVVLFSTIRGLRRRPVRLPVRRHPGDHRRRTWSALASWAGSSWSSSSSSGRSSSTRRSTRSAAARVRAAGRRRSTTCSSASSR